MKLGVISDSHGAKDRLKEALECMNKIGIRHVVHAGDFAVAGIVDLLESFSDMTFYIAIGNCDIDADILKRTASLKNCILKEVVEVKMDNYSFAISHYEGVAERNVRCKQNMIFHGHTHKFELKEKFGTTIFNPGSFFESGIFFVVGFPKFSLDGYYYDGVKIES